MRALWASAGTPTSFDSEFVRFNDVCMGPPPTTGQVPVWVGGNARGALRTCPPMGDGWHPLFPTPDLYRSGRDAIVAWRIGGPLCLFDELGGHQGAQDGRHLHATVVGRRRRRS